VKQTHFGDFELVPFDKEWFNDSMYVEREREICIGSS
jgi:hypothetical protein